jgi:alpha-beta hydrolase superfamily lysophospholipase
MHQKIKLQPVFRTVFAFLLTSLAFFPLRAQEAAAPVQPAAGPGGSGYAHEDVRFQDFAAETGGYWLFEPAAPIPDSAHVVVFVHGYGGYNPMIYGKWIKHLVRRGNIVIFPRYQRNIFSPNPGKFSTNVAQAVRDVLVELQKDGHVRPIVSKLAFVGHSYGGVILAGLAINFEKHKIPPPKVLLLCSPGTGALRGGRLDSYAAMPEDVSLLIVVSQNDRVTGDEFGIKVFDEATHAAKRNLLRQYADSYGTPPLKAHHNQAYSVDKDFDTGTRNFTSNRALRISTVDAMDYFGYWKLCDALLECTRNGGHCDVAFGGTEKQTSLGMWSDGTPVKPLEVTLPPAGESAGQPAVLQKIGDNGH